MASAKAWIKAMRLRTLPLSLASVITGTAFSTGILISWSQPHLSHEINWQIFWLTVLTTIILQILSNLANDLGDFLKGTDNDNRVGPVRALQSGEISVTQMTAAVALFSILALLSGILLLRYSFRSFSDVRFILFLLIGLLAIGAAILYTVGKRAYGYHGLGDLMVFVFFGMVGVTGTFYLQTNVLWLPIWIPSAIIGLLAVAVLNLNNMRDIVGDKAAGKITIPVRLGFKNSKVYHFMIFVIAYCGIATMYVPFETERLIELALLFPVLVMHIVHLSVVFGLDEPSRLDGELKFVAISSLLFSLIFLLISCGGGTLVAFLTG